MRATCVPSGDTARSVMPLRQHRPAGADDPRLPCRGNLDDLRTHGRPFGDDHVAGPVEGRRAEGSGRQADPQLTVDEPVSSCISVPRRRERRHRRAARHLSAGERSRDRCARAAGTDSPMLLTRPCRT